MLNNANTKTKISPEEFINELNSLPTNNGWYNAEGVGINKKAIRWLKNNFLRLYDTSLSLPHIYPTIDGNISFEYTMKDHIMVDFLFNVESYEIAISIIFLNTSAKSKYFITNLKLVAGWNVLNNSIRNYV